MNFRICRQMLTVTSTVIGETSELVWSLTEVEHGRALPRRLRYLFLLPLQLGVILDVWVPWVNETGCSV